MATFLQLCATLARESGAVGAAPTSVANQTGRQAKCVNWVAEAWSAIQSDNSDWTFLRRELGPNVQLVGGTSSYTPVALGASDFDSWLDETPEYKPVWLSSVGQAFADECELTFIPYESWRNRFKRGAQILNRPTYWSYAPDGSMVFGAVPDQPYVLRAEYQRVPQVMTADGDIPIMPDKYHIAIVWRAAMMLAQHDEAPSAYQAAAAKFGAIYDNMTQSLLPPVETRGNSLVW